MSDRRIRTRRITAILSWFLVIVAGGCQPSTMILRTNATLSKEIDVFGVRILASSRTPDEKVLHAARVMAEYLDNNEDGIADHQLVVDALVQGEAYLIMFRDESEERSFTGPYPTGVGQNLYAEETIPNGARMGVFDATLEEVLHLITHAGYASAYPSVFGEMAGSSLADAMDTARGGQFMQVPSTYPPDAWYTYDDTTCDYACQITEYIYWAITSILGGQDFPGRLEEIEDEWRPNTSATLQAQDPAVFQLLTDTQYSLPTRLPDGNYDAINLSISNN